MRWFAPSFLSPFFQTLSILYPTCLWNGFSSLHCLAYASSLTWTVAGASNRFPSLILEGSTEYTLASIWSPCSVPWAMAWGPNPGAEHPSLRCTALPPPPHSPHTARGQIVWPEGDNSCLSVGRTENLRESCNQGVKWAMVKVEVWVWNLCLSYLSLSLGDL